MSYLIIWSSQPTLISCGIKILKKVVRSPKIPMTEISQILNWCTYLPTTHQPAPSQSGPSAIQTPTSVQWIFLFLFLLFCILGSILVFSWPVGFSSLISISVLQRRNKSYFKGRDFRFLKTEFSQGYLQVDFHYKYSCTHKNTSPVAFQ